MRPDAIRSIHGGERGHRLSGTCWLILAGCILVSAGCEEEPRHTPAEAQRFVQAKKIQGRLSASGRRRSSRRRRRLRKEMPRLPRPRSLPRIHSPWRATPTSRASDGSRSSRSKHALNKFHAANDRYPKDL